ncbi:MAG TPA: RNA methyltransferase [bacterium]|nr:RNA methyltransferase [bacterium]
MAAPQITSTKNPLIKSLRALAARDIREPDDRLVVEGVRMIEEAFASGVAVEVILYDPSAMTGPRAVAVLDRARQRGVRLVTATARVVAACSQVETAQGIIAVVAHPRAALYDVLAFPQLVLVIADRIQDPGNLGAIIRIADAAEASAVVSTTGSVDARNPKAVRATMGSLFHLPVASAATPQLVTALQERRVRILLADPAGASDYTEVDYRSPIAIVLGNEGGGPDALWRTASPTTVRIPLYGRADSLNVAVAAALLLYEARRLREA